MATHRIHDGALLPERCRSLAEALLAHPLLGESPLAGTFRGSRGFALTFRRDGLDELRRRFSFLEGFLDLALDPGAPGSVATFAQRFRKEREPNAFFLNLLVLGPGGSVGRHVDATLCAPTGLTNLVPELVTVLSVQPSSLGGGELRLFRGDRRVARISSVEGRLVHFRGSLAHEVSAVPAVEGPRTAPQLRLSLVCEQYCLPPAALSALQPFQVQSKAGFDAYLAVHAGEGASKRLMFEPG